MAFKAKWTPAAVTSIYIFVLFGIFLFAVGRGGYALGLAVSRWALINIPMLFVLNALFGIYGIVWSQFVSDCIVALYSFLIYRRFRRRTVLAGEGLS